MTTELRWTLPPLRLMLALFALYAIVTVPSLLPRWGASVEGFGLLALWLLIAAVAWPIAAGRIDRRGFWPLLLLAAAALRLPVLALALGRTTVGDPKIYLDLAHSLGAGGGLSFHDPLSHIDFVALYPPAYPLLLAGIDRVARLGVPVIWASNLVIELAAAFAMVRLGMRLGHPAAGRAGAWLFATWPTFVLAAPFAQKESLVMLLVLLIALTLLRLRERIAPGWGEALPLGLAAGLLALTQPGLALLPATLGLALLPAVGLRPLLGLALRAAPIALLVLLPWWARNWAMLHHFVPLTSTGGIGLWIGNNPQATGNWMALPPQFDGLPELEASARAAALAKQWIVANPLAFAKLSLTKLVRTAGVEQFTLLRLSLLSPAPPPALYAALFPLLQGALFVLLAAGTWFTGRIRRMPGGDWLLLLLLGCVLQIVAFAIWFEFAERHRYFIMPFLLLVVGFGLERATSSREPA